MASGLLSRLNGSLGKVRFLLPRTVGSFKEGRSGNMARFRRTTLCNCLGRGHLKLKKITVGANTERSRSTTCKRMCVTASIYEGKKERKDKNGCLCIFAEMYVKYL